MNSRYFMLPGWCLQYPPRPSNKSFGPGSVISSGSSSRSLESFFGRTEPRLVVLAEERLTRRPSVCTLSSIEPSMSPELRSFLGGALDLREVRREISAPSSSFTGTNSSRSDVFCNALLAEFLLVSLPATSSTSTASSLSAFLDRPLLLLVNSPCCDCFAISSDTRYLISFRLRFTCRSLVRFGVCSAISLAFSKAIVADFLDL
mmetsp:Transcript_20786/g.48788  ORF Transcript_20786/g.48788 Transcript_20786/m.48788 type:complete len:204 (+) Transcript_20786:2496-3107(+)